MTERGAQLSIVGFWRPSMPPSPDATIIITILYREGGAIIFLGFWRPPNAPPPTQTPQYLTILMTERGGAILL